MRQPICKGWAVVEDKLFSAVVNALVNRLLKGPILLPVVQDFTFEVRERWGGLNRRVPAVLGIHHGFQKVNGFNNVNLEQLTNPRFPFD